MSESVAQLVSVSKAYVGSNVDAAAQVLIGVDLTIRHGESVAIVGPSGCGKSTLLNLIGALDTPSDGKVLVDGQDLASLNDDQLARLRNRSIGFVFQDHHLLPQCTALENILVPTIAWPDTPGTVGETRTRAMELLERVGLKDRAGYRPDQLSGGQRQRVAIVRALINQPRLLLIDEPTGSLDEHTAADIMDLLVQLNQQDGVCLVLVTHAMDLARQMGRVMCLTEGRLRPADS